MQSQITRAPIQYVFHEINIDESPDSLQQVQNLIRVYRDIPTKSRYKDIKNLIPKLTYAVLINHADGRQSARLYFNNDDINKISQYPRTPQNLEPLYLQDGVYSDTFNPDNNEVINPTGYKNYSK